jgi:3',5'-cyclic AMP phosphodiesterase CpdA
LKIIAQISDLHFGKVVPEAAEALADDLNNLKPSLLVISGDLTQRARNKQFIDAAEYLKRLPVPQLVIPGNHDIPLFDIFTRFFFPLKRFKKYITNDLMPYYEDDELSVLGLNTARSFTWKNGRISKEQIELINKKLCNVPNTKLKIVVTHHPFIPPPGEKMDDMVDRAELAMKVIDPCGIDMLLSGHLHHGYSGDVRTHYPAAFRLIIAVQAGTAISRRVRNEPNAYNVIKVENDRLEIGIKEFENGQFVYKNKIEYTNNKGEWKLV